MEKAEKLLYCPKCLMSKNTSNTERSSGLLNLSLAIAHCENEAEKNGEPQPDSEKGPEVVNQCTCAQTPDNPGPSQDRKNSRKNDKPRRLCERCRNLLNTFEYTDETNVPKPAHDRKFAHNESENGSEDEHHTDGVVIEPANNSEALASASADTAKMTEASASASADTEKMTEASASASADTATASADTAIVTEASASASVDTANVTEASASASADTAIPVAEEKENTGKQNRVLSVTVTRENLEKLRDEINKKTQKRVPIVKLERVNIEQAIAANQKKIRRNTIPTRRSKRLLSNKKQ